MSTVLCCALSSAVAVNAQRTVGLVQYDAAPSGYMLFAPLSSTTTYLIDPCGEKVHTWSSSHTPALSAQLQPDGSLLRAGNTQNSEFMAGGSGGVIERWSWDGELLWSYTISSDSLCLHHDFTVLPNGNILAIVWDRRTGADAIANGKDPATTNAYLWSERIVELQPQGTTDATVVWQWRLWDHLVQAFDNTLPNYGVVSDHPERVDINFFQGPPTSFDWIHLNSIDYNAELDQILVSSHNLDELWVIDHSTTTAEAAGPTGGNSGKGGELLYRWGNPRAYGRGTQADQQLFGQHHATWLPPGHPDAGKILVFNNGLNRPGGAYSSLEIIAPDMDNNGDYPVPTSGAFLPAAQEWIWTAPTPTDFYGQNIGGVFPVDGGFLATIGPEGRFVWIDGSGTMQWTYVSPIGMGGNPVAQGTVITTNNVFRCQHYATDFAGFDGHVLVPQGEIELDPLPSLCASTAVVATDGPKGIGCSPNPASDHVSIHAHLQAGELQLRDLAGRLVRRETLTANEVVGLDVGALDAGTYLVSLVQNGRVLAMDRLMIAR